ncbi:hypothetical protein N0V93_010320 [Gnomoniopsis smithogilvyi]|uniref:Uncharacterized protein n=1 Tax=Gnomoniopsis smithogilvyi TaxID=1191159 RepID=A0A9W9CRQ0_9PEZI|nr:hypothetical protein N0V93_010320 [Gnomoniopsis smithogilvyi]
MATARGWKITKVVLTHPFFLHGADIDKFQRYYESKMRSVWKPYEEQIDQVITFQWLGHLNVVVFDNGSSTMDIQVQTVYFNDEGAYKCAMSGSHMANEELRKLLRSDFQDNCSEEDIPIFLEKFEAMKDTLDPDKLPLDMQGQSKTTLALIGSDPQQSVTLTQNQLQLIYQKAFGPGFKAFKKTITNLLAFGKDFAVILGGGSFQSPWLARQVKEFLDAIQKKALQQPSPVLLLYALLTDFDSAFPSAVSAGAVLSAIRRKPSPMQWLKQSAFGLQRWRTSKEGDPWSPNWMAEFLLAEVNLEKSLGCDRNRRSSANKTKGCSEIPTVILNNLRPAYAKWRLILDTQYHMRPMENRYRMIKGRKVYFGIWVSQAKETIFDTLQSVDANWEITGLQLPAGKIACSVRGPQAVKFANGWGDEMPDTFVLGLDFFQINDEGTRLKHKSDKRFNLTIASDIAANMAQVVKAQELPVGSDEAVE